MRIEQPSASSQTVIARPLIVCTLMDEIAEMLPLVRRDGSQCQTLFDGALARFIPQNGMQWSASRTVKTLGSCQL